MNLVFPSPTASRRVWEALHRADTLLFSGRVGDALDVYRDVQREAVTFLTTAQSSWRVIVSESPQQPSLAGACALMGEFYGLENRWQAWLVLAEPLFDRAVWHTLPFPVRARLTALRGWAGFKRKGFTLNGIAQDQWCYLRAWRRQAQQDSFTIADHHLVLCFAYTLAFRPKKARHHGQTALHLFQQIGSPYACFKALGMLGTLDYTDKKYSAAAQWHDQADALSHTVIQGGMLTTDYTRGWVLIGQKCYDQAVLHFQRAHDLNEYQGMDYDAARCIYAESYARFRLHDDPAYTASKKRLQQAKRFFFEALQPDPDGIQAPTYAYPMKAACLHIDGLIFEYQEQFSAALCKLENAIAFQREVNDPGQMSDMRRRALYNAWRCRRIDRMIIHGVMFLILLLRFRVPVL